MTKEIKILIVDDEQDYANLIAFNFKSKGYSVITACNGEEAIRSIKERNPDVVFMDMLLPDTDGMGLLKKVREFNKEIPVIIMSAYMDDRKLGKSVDFYGVSGIFYKGDDFSKALTLLETTLRK
jgi:DNA-binding NtrC family response regulator